MRLLLLEGERHAASFAASRGRVSIYILLWLKCYYCHRLIDCSLHWHLAKQLHTVPWLQVGNRTHRILRVEVVLFERLILLIRQTDTLCNKYNKNIKRSIHQQNQASERSPWSKSYVFLPRAREPSKSAVGLPRTKKSITLLILATFSLPAEPPRFQDFNSIPAARKPSKNAVGLPWTKKSITLLILATFSLPAEPPRFQDFG